jgi:hypothetical protein
LFSTTSERPTPSREFSVALAPFLNTGTRHTRGAGPTKLVAGAVTTTSIRFALSVIATQPPFRIVG